MMYVFATCVDLIRTLPALEHDEHRPEEVSTEGDDHLYDSLRYGVMSRPWTAAAPKTPESADMMAYRRKKRRTVTGWAA